MKLNNSQTNWKYLTFIILITFILSTGILWWSKEEIVFPEFPEIKKLSKVVKDENINIDEDISLDRNIINKAIDDIVPLDISKGAINIRIADLDNNNFPEIIIYTTAFRYPKNKEPYLAITTLTEKGDYSEVSEFNFINNHYNNEYSYFLENLKDLDGDGIKEMVFNLGPAANLAITIYGLIDWNGKKIDWVKLRMKDEKIVSAIFSQGGGLSYSKDFRLADINNNGKKELIEIYNWYEPIEEDSTKTKITINIDVYEWNGVVFSYNKELSQTIEKNITGSPYEYEEPLVKELYDKSESLTK